MPVLLAIMDKKKIGRHKPMITLEEYDRIQVFLGRNGNPRAKTREFAFTGTMQCAECGCSITAEAKKKYIKSENLVKHYTYYHCTHRKKDYKCKQKSIEENKLKEQIEEKLKSFELDSDYKELAFNIIDDLEGKSDKTTTQINENINKSIEKSKKELKSLNQMRMKDFVSDDEYLENKNRINREIKRLKQNLNKEENNQDDWVEITKDIFELATLGRVKLQKGDLEEQKTVLFKLGSNRTLKDGKLFIQGAKWFLPLQKSQNVLNSLNARLEPAKTPINKSKNEAFNLACATLSGCWDSNPGSHAPKACALSQLGHTPKFN